jgi:hypothetical protein
VSIGLKISIQDRASAVLAAQKAEMAPERLALVAGRGAQNVIRGHLLTLNRTRPNKLGGKRTEYYRSAANSLGTTVQGGVATVSIRQRGFAQRVFGGTITPTSAKLLSIPVHAEAHGKRAREIPGLVYGVLKSGPALFKVRDNKIEVYYLLRRSVEQDPDPTILPDSAAITDGAVDAIASTLARARRRASSGNSSAS